MRTKVYTNDTLRVGIYSNCKYESKKIKSKNGKTKYKLVVDKQSCNYIPRKAKNKRSNYIEWEHIVPAHAFGHNLTCWNSGNDRCIKKSTGKSYKGRKCCNI